MVELIEKDSKFYLAANSKTALANKDVNEHEDLLDIWEEKEAQLHKIVYNMVDNSIFLQIKGQPTAAKMWEKLVTIYDSKGSAQFETTLLGKLQNARFTDNEDMHNHLGSMSSFRERLDEIGSLLLDTQFNAYIRMFLSLSPRFQPLLTTINTTACQSRTTVTSNDLIWQLNEEADRFKLKENQNKANTAMLAAHAKATSSQNGNGEKGKGKPKMIRNAQIAKRRDIAGKIASQKADERPTKPQTGGKKGKKRQRERRSQKKMQMLQMMMLQKKTLYSS